MAKPSPTHSHGTALQAGIASASAPQASFRLRVRLGDQIAIGPGKIALLEAIGTEGSISAAAKRLGMSYKRAWDLLNTINQSLATPAIGSERGGPHGGGSVLTPEGRELVRLYRAIEVRAAQACSAELDSLLDLLKQGG
ncbi:MAG: winged helix-turn-helix domain-containing protein [Janthinobacterium lividum]